MAKPPKPGKCVHCLRHLDNLNWDHVFPVSWYPDTTPANLFKWKVPSCLRCNNKLGKIENEFFILVAMCLDPNEPASKSIVQKALRSMKPEYAKTSLDKLARLSLAKKIRSRTMQGNEIPPDSIYPALSEKWGRPAGSGIALTIPADSFRRITEKIVRGISFLEDGRFIEPPHTIEFFALDDKEANSFREAIDKFGNTLAREPGIIVRRAVLPEDGVSAIYEIEFWKQFKTHAVVLDDVPKLTDVS